MPRPFTEKERESIRLRLLNAAEECWSRHGIKRTTVDELALMAGISKGSFYLFYESKELLFLDVIERIERETKQAFFSALSMPGKTKKETFMNAVDRVYATVRKAPWLLSLQSGDYEALARNLPSDRIVRHVQVDESDVASMLAALGVDSHLDIKVVAGALRAVFFTLLHRREIGEEHFDAVYRMLLEGLSHQLFQEEDGR
ncbi:MAG: TetR/AcrR family transcriptional regulator [Firmicutes bacterium]|nr:TetR/AcrR family transcriptional regulator [Bacillota bacterium]